LSTRVGVSKPLVEIDSKETLNTIVMRANDNSDYSSADGKWMQLLHPAAKPT
jgi:hypothetical protein